MRVPAFCDTCGTVFPSGFNVENSTVTFASCTAGPCPVCGGMGRIPDGVFGFFGNTINILSAPTRTREELGRLANIIEEARAKRQTPQHVADQIRKEVPKMASVADLLIPKSAGDFYALLIGRAHV